MKISFWICSLSSWNLIHVEYCSWRLFDPIYIIHYYPKTLLMHSLLCHQSAFTYVCIHTSAKKVQQTRQGKKLARLFSMSNASFANMSIPRKVLQRKSRTSHKWPFCSDLFVLFVFDVMNCQPMLYKGEEWPKVTIRLLG